MEQVLRLLVAKEEERQAGEASEEQQEHAGGPWPGSGGAGQMGTGRWALHGADEESI